jgi:hypothetical protein
MSEQGSQSLARPVAHGADEADRQLSLTGSTTARSVDEVAPIRDTISQYTPVLIGTFVNPKFVAPAGRKISGAPIATRRRLALARRHGLTFTVPTGIRSRSIAEIKSEVRSDVH